ncbi:OPT/YSL family transporter, partial [Campylobacter jejuni]
MMYKKQNLPELTLRGLILGSILTIIFTASNVYLGLKVGLTFSSSIPAVVI